MQTSKGTIIGAIVAAIVVFAGIGYYMWKSDPAHQPHPQPPAAMMPGNMASGGGGANQAVPPGAPPPQRLMPPGAGQGR